jgi:hypothetical protein
MTGRCTTVRKDHANFQPLRENTNELKKYIVFKEFNESSSNPLIPPRHSSGYQPSIYRSTWETILSPGVPHVGSPAE